jgi:SAM-dependent methyltransferase
MTVCEQFEDLRCDMCGSADRTILYQYQLHANQANIVVCDRCGFTYLCPRPKSSRLHEFYGETYYSFRIERTRQSSLKDALRRTVMKHHFSYSDIYAADILNLPAALTRLFKAFVAVPHYRQDGRLLDVGCGAGQKLLEFKSLGWDVRGVELSERAAAEGRKLGLDIVVADLSNAPWPADTFSAITFYHSLEHLPSPRQALRMVFKLLHPGGEMLIVGPNFGCIERKLFGRDWNWLDVPVHFSHFTKATLTWIIAEAGFRIETVGFSAAGCSASLPVSNRLPAARKLADKAIRVFGVACAAAGSGKALIVSARK